MILLSGILNDVAGSPGVMQAVRLRGLLQSRNLELARIEEQMAHLQQEIQKLENNPIIQEREIRRVLGYAAQDEIIFDFNQNNALH